MIRKFPGNDRLKTGAYKREKILHLRENKVNFTERIRKCDIADKNYQTNQCIFFVKIYFLLLDFNYDISKVL